MLTILRRSNSRIRDDVMKRDRKRGVPVFGLYGDLADAAVPEFIHVERIVTRAPLHDWEIRGHRHVHLSQAFLVVRGGGHLQIEADQAAFHAPWTLWVPSGVVHGFRFDPGTDGYVVTVSDDFLNSVVEKDPEERRLRSLMETVTNEVMGSVEEIDINLVAVFEAIAREAASALPGSYGAVGALLKLLLIGLLRTTAVRAGGQPHSAARTTLVRRFRNLVEAHFRDHWPVARYAAELGITTDRLHTVCTEDFGRPPKALVHDRLMLEAKRSLIYTTLSVSEIAFDLGFEDTAYFSRFFAKRAGTTAMAYRIARSAGTRA